MMGVQYLLGLSQQIFMSNVLIQMELLYGEVLERLYVMLRIVRKTYNFFVMKTATASLHGMTIEKERLHQW